MSPALSRPATRPATPRSTSYTSCRCRRSTGRCGRFWLHLPGLLGSDGAPVLSVFRLLLGPAQGNALYLAQLGWRVTGVDVAKKGLAFAQQRAHALGVPLTTEVHDMATYNWDTDKWDLIVLSYTGRRDYAPRVARALKPGGLVALEAFHMDATKHLQVVDGNYRVFLNTDELPKLYGGAGLKIVRYEEPVAPADFTKETLRLVQLVA